MPIGKKLISNTFFLFLKWVGIFLFSFLFWSALSKTLSPSEYGTVATSINFIVFLSSISLFGVDIAIAKLIPEINKKEGKNSVWAFVRLSFKSISVSILISAVILLFLSTKLSALLKIPYYMFIISILGLILYSIYVFLISVLYGLQNMKSCFFAEVSQVILRLGLTLVLFFFGLSYFSPLIAFSLSYFFLIFFVFNPSYLKKSGTTKYSYHKIFSFALPALTSQIFMSVIANGQYIILTVLKSTTATGLFGVAFAISSVIGIATNILSQALFPILSELSIDHKTKKRQGYLIGLVIRYSFLFSIPVSLLLIFFSKFIVLLFSRSQYLSSTLYFPILVPAAIFYSLGSFLLSNLYAMGKPKIQRNIAILAAFLFISTSIFLSNYFTDARGICFAYLITMFSFFILSFLYIRKFLRIEFFVHDTLKILFSSLLIILVFFILQNYIQTILAAILFSIGAGLIYLMVLWLLKFYKMEDIRILEFFSERIPVISKYILWAANFIKKRL